MLIAQTIQCCHCTSITAGMIGYGLAKAAVHQLVQSLAEPAGGLPSDAGVVGILP